jgi:hypothetical protein
MFRTAYLTFFHPNIILIPEYLNESACTKKAIYHAFHAVIEGVKNTEYRFLTQRCKVRKFMEKDLQSFMSYRNNQQWMKYQSYKDLPEDEYRKTLLADVGFEHGINLAIIKEDLEKLIGD